MKILVKNNSWALIAMAFVLCSCAKDNQPLPDKTQVRTVDITTSIADQTTQQNVISDPKSRVSLTGTTSAFETGDKIGLYLVEWNMDNTAATSPIAKGNQTDNHLYTKTATGWNAASLTNPLTWRKVDAYAYYPYNSALTDALSIPFTPRVDQSAGIISSDYLMWGKGSLATGYEPAKGNKIDLTFINKLTLLKVNVTLPTTYNGKTISGITAVKSLLCPASFTMNIATGDLTPSSTASTITMHRSSGTGLTGLFEAVVSPCTLDQYKEMISVDYTTTPSGTGTMYFSTPTGGLTLASNQIHTITLATTEFGFASEFTAPFATTAAPVQQIQVISSNAATPWSVTNDGNAWITVSLTSTPVSGFVSSLTSQTGDKIIYVKVADNDSGLPRLGSLKLSASGFADRQIVIRQN
ncbi:MAG: fimbrillin family protein [Mucinivorans sp.]